MKLLETYLRGKPEFIMTSIRLPLQRQLSWFRQQNRNAENPNVTATSPECATRNETLLHYFDKHWAPNKFSASQWYSMQERSARLAASAAHAPEYNASAIIEQFDFILVKERLRESYECLCTRAGIRLCDGENPMEEANVKPTSSCVERQLLGYRGEELLKGAANDLRLYEFVNNFVTKCQKEGIPEACHCGR